MRKRDYYKIIKEILPKLENFESDKKHLMFASPISHTLKGFYFDNSSIEGGFYLHWFFQPLCDQTDYIVLNYGQRLSASGGTQIWFVDTPRLAGEMLAKMRTPISFLDELRNEHDIVNGIKNICKGNEGFHDYERTAYLLILAGDYRAAEREFHQLFHREAEATRNWELQLFETAHSIHKLLTQNPDRALERIRAWRLAAVKKLGLEKWATR